MNDKKEFLNVEDVSNELEISQRTIRKLFKNKVIPSKKIARKYFITRDQLKRYIEENNKERSDSINDKD
jgi:excisionase family DNA binding protein